MRAYIKKLQTKDEIVRKQIFAGLMIFSMAIVSFIWIYNLSDRFDKKIKEQVRDDIKPFQLFANSISSTYKNISASVGNISTPKVEETVSVQDEKKVLNEKQVGLIVIEEIPSQ